MDIERLRAEGISYRGVTLMYDPVGSEWDLKFGDEFIAWAVRRDDGWRVCAPSSRNPFDIADVIDDGLTEAEAVADLGVLGRQATAKAD
ncbi:hypothetical protein [Azospirillum brasilense]|uniref:hypothetical protein n=1 Tax=Azospirillum brasilense TaxID=192 RepID=UPI000E67966C|nr:hypothetical protein [Azospirillum brasilense]NUB23335.1 hypothetical protein [Azospirillum brasilense]NUB30957.1 hypothetical protein [Azospirillum brasilense]RIW05659.1 hypothetical protein D2T81_07385 [Azospirillum brasilense]